MTRQLNGFGVQITSKLWSTYHDAVEECVDVTFDRLNSGIKEVDPNAELIDQLDRKHYTAFSSKPSICLPSS